MKLLDSPRAIKPTVIKPRKTRKKKDIDSDIKKPNYSKRGTNVLNQIQNRVFEFEPIF